MRPCIGDNLLFFGDLPLSVKIKDPQQPAKACVIWMHGLGADGNDMAGLAAELPLAVPVRHVFMDAPIRPVTLNNNMSMRAWYDIVGMKLTDREDRAGILASENLIRTVIEQQCAAGFKPSQIFLAGFSQGAAMALRTGLHLSTPLAGVIALSGYLPLSAECKPALDLSTPIWIAAGQFDPIVLPGWTKHAFDWFVSQGFKNVHWHEYPMEHTLCLEEIRDLAHFLSTQILSFGVKQ